MPRSLQQHTLVRLRPAREQSRRREAQMTEERAVVQLCWTSCPTCDGVCGMRGQEGSSHMPPPSPMRRQSAGWHFQARLQHASAPLRRVLRRFRGGGPSASTGPVTAPPAPSPSSSGCASRARRRLPRGPEADRCNGGACCGDESFAASLPSSGCCCCGSSGLASWSTHEQNSRQSPSTEAGTQRTGPFSQLLA